MAEEITENKTIITDEILSEMEKVSKLEKSLNFLNFRQGSIEKEVSTLGKVVGNNFQPQEKVDNVISEEIDGEEAVDKDNVVRDDKLKPFLTSIEKKRYENIGVEFIKGSQKVFDEIKRAEELKKKMSTKKIDEIKEKEQEVKKKEKQKKTGSLGSLFLKLGLAITSIYLVLDTFKDKIGKIIPNFSESFDNFTSPVKNLLSDILNRIGEFLDKTVGDEIRQGFQYIRAGVDTFFTISLPNSIYKAGLAIVKAFGGKITEDMENMQVFALDSVYNSLKNGKQLAEQRQAMVYDPFATKSQLEKVERNMAFDAFMNLGDVGKQYIAQLGGIMTAISENKSEEEKQKMVTNSHLNSLMTTLVESKFLLDNKIDNDELRLIYDRLGLSSGSTEKERDDNFQAWSNRDDVKSFFGLIPPADGSFSPIVKAYESFQQKLKNFHQKEDFVKRWKEFEEGSKNKINEKVEIIKGEVKVSPVSEDEVKKTLESELGSEVAQDAFVKNLWNFADAFNKTFGGDELGTKFLDSAKTVVEKVYNDLLYPFVKMFANAMDIISGKKDDNPFSKIQITLTEQKDKSKKQGKQEKSSSSPAPVSLVPNGQSSSKSPKTDISTTTLGPVVLIDFSLDAGIVGAIGSITKSAEELVTKMQDTNGVLTSIKDYFTNNVPKDAFKKEDFDKIVNTIEQIKNGDIQYCKNNFDVITGRLENIEQYLESQDGDGVADKGNKDFPLQAKS